MTDASYLILRLRAFENNLTRVLINILPAMTARKGHKGRAICFEAFENYFQNKHHERGSSLVRARHEASNRYAVSIKDIAHFEVGGILAILDNTMPTAFWMLYYIFSSPSILAELRSELGDILHTNVDSKGLASRAINVTGIKEHCPFLVSLFHETLRHRSCGVSTREVLQETTLSDKYLLKAGSVIQMPSRVIHFDPTVWGPTYGEFDAKRFMRRDLHGPKDPKIPSGAFQAFGGGTTLCPGRYFARTEVMCTVAMFVMRFEMEPLGGEWCMPPPKGGNIAAAVVFPGADIKVNVKAREGYEDGSWAFQLT